MEPENKAITSVTREFVEKIQNVEYIRGASSILLLPDENLENVFMGVAFNLYSPFFEAFNEKIDLLVSNGMSKIWLEEFLIPKGKKRFVEKLGPQVLTFEHLTVGFLICMIMLMLSAFVFILEISLWGFKLLVETTIEYLTALSVVWGCMNIRPRIS